MKLKVYTFDTVDQDGHEEQYTVEAYSISGAKWYRANIIANSKCGEKTKGHIKLKD